MPAVAHRLCVLFSRGMACEFRVRKWRREPGGAAADHRALPQGDTAMGTATGQGDGARGIQQRERMGRGEGTQAVRTTRV